MIEKENKLEIENLVSNIKAYSSNSINIIEDQKIILKYCNDILKLLKENE